MKMDFQAGESTPFFHNIVLRLTEFLAEIKSAKNGELEVMRHKFSGVLMAIRGSRMAGGHDELIAILQTVAGSLALIDQKELQSTLSFINVERPTIVKKKKEAKRGASSVPGSIYGAMLPLPTGKMVGD
jgi:hypothetical protein